jgi:four helix bundle protein
MPVKSYQDLIAWQRAMELVVEVYEMTKGFPKDERFGLTNQVRRAAVSVPSNIAEGQGRGVGAEFAHHLRIAQGSLQEVETQVILGQRLGFTRGGAELLSMADETGRLLRGLHKTIRC